MGGGWSFLRVARCLLRGVARRLASSRRSLKTFKHDPFREALRIDRVGEEGEARLGPGDITPDDLGFTVRDRPSSPDSFERLAQIVTGGLCALLAEGGEEVVDAASV